MSLILDALNRAERERSICQAAPTIETLHYVDRPARAAFMWRLVLLGALLILGAVVVLLAWRFANASGVTGQAESLRANPLAFVPADASGAKPPLAGALAEGDRVPAEERGAPDNTQAGVGPRSDAVYEPAGSEASLRAPAAVSSSGDDDLIGLLYQATSRATTHGERDSVNNSQPALASHSAPQAGAEQAVPEQVLVEDVPYITDLPLQLRRDIPSLNYTEHLPEAPGGARVRLNGRLVGEGQQVVAGLELLAIEDHGIVLQFRGVPFRLPALNRWVNF